MPLPHAHNPLLHKALAFHGNGLHSQRLKIMAIGVTGYLGQWLVAYLLQSKHLKEATFTFLNRNSPQNWTDYGPFVSVYQADLSQAPQLIAEHQPDVFIHFASSSNAQQNYAAPLTVLQNAQPLDLIAKACVDTGTHLIYASSGAVYGSRTYRAGPCQEDQAGAGLDPDTITRAYAINKLYSEAILAAYHFQFQLRYTSLRLFAFASAGLPLTAHFAVGNFAWDAAHGVYPKLSSDGSPIRSWMHPADMAGWIERIILQKIACGPLNCGSPIPINLSQTAQACALMARINPQPELEIHPDHSAYWPQITKANRLGLQISLTPQDALRDLFEYATSVCV